MSRITAVFDAVVRLTTNQQLHQDVQKQIFLYLFFFSSTSIFNKLFQEGKSSFMVSSATFNNISAISWRSVL
jgi:hypothetical protein